MKTTQEIFDILKSRFNDNVLELVNTPVEPVITVAPAAINEVAFFLRDEIELDFNNLMCLSAVDDANGKTITNPDGSITIEGGTLSVYYHINSIYKGHKLCLRVSVPKDAADIPTVSDVWNHANWQEREAYDMIGINFLNHPNLIRILMPYDWDAGFPLRKDYKSPEFYHGMKIPYN